MAHSNKQFIINLVIASLISLALVSFSMAPAYLFLIKNNWLMITIGFVIYALEAWGYIGFIGIQHELGITKSRR